MSEIEVDFVADMYDRTRMLIGQDGLDQLKQAHVLVAGVGGVGSFTAEALARAGVGTITILDNDIVDITNLNRQIHATQNTIGTAKVTAMADRIHAINPAIKVYEIQAFLLQDNLSVLGNAKYDYIIDAVDTVTAKLALVSFAREKNIPIICSMGTANKLDATKFEITDISKTHTCPLARVMRKALRDRGIEKGVEVLYSTAKPIVLQDAINQNGRPPGSISYVPSVAGLLLAGHVIQKLLGVREEEK